MKTPTVMSLPGHGYQRHEHGGPLPIRYSQRLEHNNVIKERRHDTQREGFEEGEGREKHIVEGLAVPLPIEQPEIDQRSKQGNIE